MADVVFVIHPAAFQKLTKFRTGEVGTYIEKVTKVVHVAIKEQAPAPGKPPINRTFINYATGRLEDSIHFDVVANGAEEVTGIVGVGEEHAKYVIHGTVPHVIKPKTKKVLYFFWHKKGRFVALKHVNHPGTMANDFMTRGFIAGSALFGIR
ncbi:MAG TPA: HK97 gp10 family phage protein [Thermomicrobiales bacterium]|jgi:hypothetical protein